MSILNTSIQHFTGGSSQSIKARKRKKGIQIGKEGVKLSLFTDDLIIYVEKSDGIYKTNTRTNKCV